MASITLVIKTKDLDSSSVTAASSKHASLANLSNLLNGISSGANNPSATVDVAYSSTNPVAASGTVTCVLANTDADDTITIGGEVLTAKASGANGTTQFNAATDNATMATNLKNCINANTVLSKLVVASVASNVVTITCLQKGLIGNLITLISSDADGLVVSGGALTGGTGGVNGAFTSY
jgi:phage tail sheath gpL-like